MTCARCGHQLGAGDRFCGGCGAPQGEAGVTSVGISATTGFDTDRTQLGGHSHALGSDADQTRLGTSFTVPPDDDQTRLGTGSPLPIYDDRTRPGTSSPLAAHDPDETLIGSPRTVNDDATRLVTDVHSIKRDTAGTSTRGGSPRDQGGPLIPGQAFGGRYHIVQLLGLGGMGRFTRHGTTRSR